jgi:hypothetical protein
MYIRVCVLAANAKRTRTRDVAVLACVRLAFDPTMVLMVLVGSIWYHCFFVSQLEQHIVKSERFVCNMYVAA